MNKNDERDQRTRPRTKHASTRANHGGAAKLFCCSTSSYEAQPALAKPIALRPLPPLMIRTFV
eukprot:6184271-Pleurochrysis_carterae.AAC.7